MEMFLMGLCLSLLGVAVAALAFRAAAPPESSTPQVQPAVPAVKTATQARFFGERGVPVIPPQQMPIEVLLLQIEKHVRLEQAAAESFVAFPSHDLLHSKTTSPFVN